MGVLKKIKKHRIAYVYSEVSVDGEEFLIPFDGNTIPMKYEELKNISKNLAAFLSKVEKESYETFYNERLEEVRNSMFHSSEKFNQKRYEEKKEQEKKYIEKFDYNISKPILEEKEIEKILKKFPLYPRDFIDTREIKYPVIINFYKDKSLLKSMTCFKNIIQTLSNVKKSCDYDSYSYSYISEEYIGQVLEYIILFKNPLQTSSLSLKDYVVYCPLNILIKRLNKDKDYMFRKDRVLKLLEKNKIEYFEKDGRIIVNACLVYNRIPRSCSIKFQ